MSHLNDRHLEVLRLLARGQTVTEISTQLHLSRGGVRSRQSTIYALLGVRNRSEAVYVAQQRGLIEPPAKAQS
jgi:two-component system response regulator DesR